MASVDWNCQGIHISRTVWSPSLCAHMTRRSPRSICQSSFGGQVGGWPSHQRCRSLLCRVASIRCAWTTGLCCPQYCKPCYNNWTLAVWGILQLIIIIITTKLLKWVSRHQRALLVKRSTSQAMKSHVKTLVCVLLLENVNAHVPIWDSRLQ